jgi:ABC-type multidrug transport system fused ATPase/permease subunit
MLKIYIRGVKMNILGLNVDVMGWAASSLFTMVIGVIFVFIIGWILALREFNSWRYEVRILTPDLRPTYMRGKIIEKDGEKHFYFTNSMWAAFFKNCNHLPIGLVPQDMLSKNIVWMSEARNGDLKFMRISEVENIDDLKNTDFLTKEEKETLRRYKLLPSSAFANVKFEELDSEEVRNEIIHSAVKSAFRTQKPKGIIENLMTILLILGALFIVYLILDSANKNVNDINTKSIELQKQSLEFQREFNSMLYSGGFCTRYCNSTNATSVIIPNSPSNG